MFQPLELRADAGLLWENFLISERRKRLAYAGRGARLAFWRTHSGSELDLLEEENGTLRAWEFKWNARRQATCPQPFRDSYPDAPFAVVHPDSFSDFLLES
jgi:predicted AAA+ superfamily ATPase